MTEQRLTDTELDEHIDLYMYTCPRIAEALRELKAQRRANLLPTPWRAITTLPPARMFCLVTTRDAIVQSAEYQASHAWYSEDGHVVHDVVAWMPLPSPAPGASAPSPLATRTQSPKNSLERTAIAWALTERIVDVHAVKLTRIEEEVAAFLTGSQAKAVELERNLEEAKASFHLADQHATKCEGEFRQAARELLAAVEGRDPSRLLTAEADALRASGLPSSPQCVELLTHIVNRLVKLQ
jgi:hypothetical protein